jgi:hypothetical protein
VFPRILQKRSGSHPDRKIAYFGMALEDHHATD